MHPGNVAEVVALEFQGEIFEKSNRTRLYLKPWCSDFINILHDLISFARKKWETQPQKKSPVEPDIGQ